MTRSTLSKLSPLENLTQVDKIELSLQQYLRSGNFMPGDALPKELELAAALGVSRTAIREAISRFKTLGIIESRKNRGMVISRPDVLNNMQRILDTQLLDGDTMKDIFEMRLVLEIGIADLLFLRKTQESIDTLQEVVEKEEQTTNQIEIIRYDVEFHSILYAISGNHTIQRFQKLLLPIFDYVDKGLHLIRSPLSQSRMDTVTHRMLLDTLINGDPEEFRSRMRNHLVKYFEKI